MKKVFSRLIIFLALSFTDMSQQECAYTSQTWYTP
jgi:hypothetical protein